jgi:hypothetical protein
MDQPVDHTCKNVNKSKEVLYPLLTQHMHTAAEDMVHFHIPSEDSLGLSCYNIHSSYDDLLQLMQLAVLEVWVKQDLVQVEAAHFEGHYCC